MCDWEHWKLGNHQPEELTARWDDKKASVTSAKPIEERWEALPSVREEWAAENPCKHASLRDASEGKTSSQVHLLAATAADAEVPTELAAHTLSACLWTQDWCPEETPGILTNPVNYFPKDKRKPHFS